MAVKLTKWDIQDYIKTPKDQAEYLEAVLEDGDLTLLAAALGDIARARGASKMAEKSQISRQTIYKQLRAGGNPSLDTITKLTAALGIKLRISATWEQEQAKSA